MTCIILCFSIVPQLVELLGSAGAQKQSIANCIAAPDYQRNHYASTNKMGREVLDMYMVLATDGSLGPPRPAMVQENIALCAEIPTATPYRRIRFGNT